MDTKPEINKNNSEHGSKSFGEHLEDFRRHFIRIIVVQFLVFIIVFANKNILFGKIITGTGP